MHSEGDNNFGEKFLLNEETFFHHDEFANKENSQMLFLENPYEIHQIGYILEERLGDFLIHLDHKD